MSNDFEKLIIKTLFSNDDVCSKVLPSLDETWFSDIDCKIIAQEIIDFNGKFGRMPNVIETKQLLNNANNVETSKVFQECIDIPDEEANTEFLLGEIEEFVRKKLCYNASNEIVKYVTQGTHPTYSFADALSDAETFTFDTNIGFSVFGDLKRLYEDANTKEKIMKTGVKTIDDMLMGGLHESSLNLFMSSTNVGKTLIMCSLATYLIQNGFKVLYVTFEDSENKIAARIAQNMFNVTQTQFKLMSQNDFGNAYTIMKNKYKGFTNDSLVVKEFPESSTNALALKSLLKDLEDKKKFKPDVMFVDYIGCMIPNGRINSNVNEASILRTVSQQVRAVGQEWNIPIVSASQTNRGGYNAAEVGLNDIADSFGVTQKADAIISVTQTPELKEQGMYQLKLLKTRYGNNKEQVATIGVDIEKQRIYDLTGSTPSQNQVNIFDKASKTSDTTSASNILDMDIEL